MYDFQINKIQCCSTSDTTFLIVHQFTTWTHQFSASHSFNPGLIQHHIVFCTGEMKTTC